MTKQYHILNGDALKNMFPKFIPGKILVCRECLVEGSVKGKNPGEIFTTRAEFISTRYKGHSKDDYFQKTVSEFDKMKDIPLDADINLWFEDDLFCQVNFWFVIYLLNWQNKDPSIYLVRPKPGCEYNFGRMDESDLVTAFEDRIKVSEVQQLSGLWKSYQDNDCEKMLETANSLKEKYHFLMPAIKAHMDRRPDDKNPGRLVESIKNIMTELQTDEFAPIFREFCKRESIYGFGDLQVKHLIDEIKVTYPGIEKYH